MVRILLREGEDVHQRTHNKGNTPMHIAARHGHFLIVKYLIEIGAQTSVTNLEGQTPIKYLEEALVADPDKRELLAKKLKGKK